MAEDDLTSAAGRLASILGETSLLVGGLAVSAWGHVRATEDVDLVSSLEPEEIRKRLSDHGLETELKKGDPLEDVLPWVIHGSVGSVSFQVFPPPVPLDWGKATAVAMPDGSELRVVDLSGLIRLKIRAGGTRDLWDVGKLLEAHPDQKHEARRCADEAGLLDALDRWLDDSRLKR